MRIALLSTIEAPYLGHIVAALVRHEVVIDCVLFDPLNPSEKECKIEAARTGGKFPSSPFWSFESLNIPGFHVKSHLSEACFELIRGRKLDLLINAHTPRSLKSRILGAPRIGIINCHPGLLPDFRGCSCVEWAIFLDLQIGNTVHFMDAEIDTGPIILSEPLVFSKMDRYRDVRIAVYREGFNLLGRATQKIIMEDLNPEKLPPQKDGRSFKVIPEGKLEAVIEKLNRGEYAFQK